MITKQEYIDDLLIEFKDEYLEEEKEKYYKSPGLIKSEILSQMTDSEIAEIILDKKREWGVIEQEKRSSLFGTRGDNRKMIEALYSMQQQRPNLLIKELSYILRSRNNTDSNNTTREDLERAKNSISIDFVIEVITGIKLHNTRRLIKCPFPDHKDGTPSMKIYSKTNSFYCQGCHRGGSQIDFIKHYYSTDDKLAIRKFLDFYNK